MGDDFEDIPASFWDDVVPSFDFSNPPAKGTKALMQSEDGTYRVAVYKGRSESGKFLFDMVYDKIKFYEPTR